MIEVPAPTVALFPVPRSIELLDEPGPPPGAPLAVHHDPDLPDQGYSLLRDASGTRIGYRDDAGLRYARQTLDQVCADRDLAARAVRIRDWPDFAVRGFMLDVSRDRVPTRRTLRRYVEVLAAARMNQLELYTEHTFAYAGHGEVWAAADPLTAEDMRWLDALCAAHGIALVANQNTLGHMERWLVHERYRHRAETPEGFEIGGRYRRPSTLHPDPANAEFVVGLVRELAATVRARRVNIGADEPWELGKGRSAPDAAERGLGRVYLDHLLRVAIPLRDDGYEVLFWADVLADHPELADVLPAGLTPVVWQYDSPTHARAAVQRASEEQHRQWAADGFDVAALSGGFRERAKALIGAGRPFWVAPGTSSWNSVIGRLDNAVENLLDAAEVGREHGAVGYVVTTWGDNGHHEPPTLTCPPLLLGAALSWCLDSNRSLDLPAALDRIVFAEDGAGLGAALTAIGSVAHLVDAPLLNASAVFAVLVEGGDAAAVPAAAPAALEEAERVLAVAADVLARARPAGPDGDIAVRETAQAVAIARFAVALLAAGGVAELAPHEAAERLARLDALLAEQRACWLLSARPGGLDDSIARFARLRAALARRARA